MTRKHMTFMLSGIMVLSMAMSGISVTAEETEELTTEAAEDVDFLSEIQGTYIELFPEMSKEEYRDIWLEETGALVGEENAEEATDMLLAMCMAEIYGQEAIDAYGDWSDGMAFNCFFLGGISELTIDGDTISGVDEDGEEVFSHVYDYVKTDENGSYLYQSEDGDSGQFTWFSFTPDTMEDAWHVEFRYAEDVEDLASWFEGSYAYWNVGAIAKDYTDEDMANAIHLFATENLSEE